MLINKDDRFVEDGGDPMLHEGHWYMVDPEPRLLGAGYARGGWREEPDGEIPGFTVQRPGHWAFAGTGLRSEEHTSELQSLMRISYAVFCLKKTNTHTYC